MAPDSPRPGAGGGTKIADVLQCISMDAALLRYPAEPWRESPEIQQWDQWSVGEQLDALGLTWRLIRLPGGFTVVL